MSKSLNARIRSCNETWRRAYYSQIIGECADAPISQCLQTCEKDCEWLLITRRAQKSRDWIERKKVGGGEGGGGRGGRGVSTEVKIVFIMYER